MPADVSLLLLVVTLLAHHRICGAIDENPLQRQITHGGPRPFGSEKPSRAEEFNKTKVLLPEYQIRATLQPGNVSQFHYLSPKVGPALTLLVSPCSGPISWNVSYVGPPDADQHTEGSKILSVFLKTMIPSPPLFHYWGAETRNFTIPNVKADLYRIEMKPLSAPNLEFKTRWPNTVLLYATSDAAGHLPGNFESLSGKHQLQFKQKRSRRRLIVSWNKSPHTDHVITSYCIAVTSGSHLPPPTLCAAENILKKHAKPIRVSGSRQSQIRNDAEGLHCVKRTKLTLYGMKYNVTYHFTLYIMNMRSNVSNRIAMASFKFQRVPPTTLQAGRYATANLRKSEGFANFRYRPPDNTTTIFHILACGGGIIRAKFRGSGYLREEQIDGHGLFKAPSLPPGRKYTIQITATPSNLIRMSTVKVLATHEGSVPYPDNVPQSPPSVYRALRKCNEVTVGVKPAGTTKYCIAVRELPGPSALLSFPTFPEQCATYRRRRSLYTRELCEENLGPTKNDLLPFTVNKLQPGRAYLLQISAEAQGQHHPYPAVRVRTQRSCRS